MENVDRKTGNPLALMMLKSMSTYREKCFQMNYEKKNARVLGRKGPAIELTPMIKSIANEKCCLEHWLCPASPPSSLIIGKATIYLNRNLALTWNK